MWRFDDLIIVNEVIKQKSFSKASKSLHIPSSTISRRVSEFEAAIGVRLLERNSRKISLTDKGELLFKQCNEQLQSIKSEVNALSVLHALPEGPIKVTAPITLGNEVLSQFFCEFAQRHPKITLDIKLTNVIEDMLNDSFDVAIRVGPLADSGFIGKPLFSTKSVLVASSKYLIKNNINLSDINTLHDCHFLGYQKDQRSFTAVNNQTKTNKNHLIPVTTVLSSSSTTMLRNAALNHLGIALLPYVSVKDLIESQALINIFSTYEIGDTKNVYAVYPSKKHVSERLALFLSELTSFTEQLGSNEFSR